MKFRTDFVTNSSDSSFLTFNIKNKKLFDFLTGLGIKLDTSDGTFTESMTITLPSGESSIIDGFENWLLPYPNDYKSISAWVLGLILWEVEDRYPSKDADEYSDFARELIDIFNKAGILNLDWAMVSEWSRDDVADAFEEAVGKMDGDITEAEIEHNYGFEGEVGPLVYEQISGGNRLSVYLDEGGFWDDDDDLFDDEDDDEDEAFAGHGEDCEGMKFVITGKLEHFENREEMVEYIEELGGTVSDSVSKNTHFLICNDLSSTSSKMKKAKALCVPVITEEAFIRRFGDPDDYDLPEMEDLGDDLWSVTYEGGFYEMLQKTGIGEVFTRVWKKGNWVSK